MYNSIYPVNINYRKPDNLRNNEENSQRQNLGSTNSSPQNQTFPNGQKVAIDYTKGQINISQVLTDFRSTIIAINAPDDVKDEVNIYLNLVDKESKKENPSKDIVLSNLKNASRVSDAYIAASLKKPSNVVEGWIDALFLQKINLKADPNEINQDFLLEFPKKAQDKIEQSKKEALVQSQKKDIALIPQNENLQNQPQATEEISFTSDFQVQNENEIYSDDNFEQNFDVRLINEQAKPIADVFLSNFLDEQEPLEIESTIELGSSDNYANDINLIHKQDIQEDYSQYSQVSSPFEPQNETDLIAKDLYLSAKASSEANDDTQAINMLNEALGLLEDSPNSNENIRAALHFERGKLFDSYDYVDYALRDYFEATKADELNLKAQAYYKSGQIYDEFKEYSPALDNYISSVGYSGEADNQSAQAKVLSSIADLYAKQYMLSEFTSFSNLAIDSAIETKDDMLIGKTYSNSAQNLQYLGENSKALTNYKEALEAYFLSGKEESFEQMAYNYEQAALTMEKLGNHSKAQKLQSKANQYYQKSQQFALS